VKVKSIQSCRHVNNWMAVYVTARAIVTGDDSSSKGPPDEPEMRGGGRAFLATVDTEGDNQWSRSQTVTTRNAKFLGRFQELCEKHRIKPTYLATYEMANDAFFREFGRDVLRRGTAEIGMHLHAWNSPPDAPISDNDSRHHPYLIEYAPSIMGQKIDCLSDLLEDVFQTRIMSHRAGRWSFNETYARLLSDRGYKVDCSVTPHISWKAHVGHPSGVGGTDYRGFPEEPYFIDLSDIGRPGKSAFLEVPLTVWPGWRTAVHEIVEPMQPANPLRRLVNLMLPSCYAFSPRRFRLAQLSAIIQKCICENRDCVHFTVHSSELMPGGSPAFPTKNAIERLYARLESVFDLAGQVYPGATLTEYYELLSRQR